MFGNARKSSTGPQPPTGSRTRGTAAPLAAPEMLPVLSRGKHRNPRKGACFMELASYLAGERWSDHPACTHPLLAALARSVNDCTTDAGRSRLGVLIPSVIGLTSDDLHLDVQIALRSATTALPVASAERQGVLAVAVLACHRVLAELDGRPEVPLDDVSREALRDVPQAASWARRFADHVPTTAKGFRQHAAPAIVGNAVLGIAQACIADPDTVLRDLLAATIADCEAAAAAADAAPGDGGRVDQAAWDEVCALTGGSARG